ncbi:MAG: hypothetical protein IKB38_10275 [Clostridia bacterium]|nr:hypothetical protein [Clostridia bacterium]
MPLKITKEIMAPRRRSKENDLAPHKLQLLFTVVDRRKAEFYTDILQSFEVNMQISLSARGTAKTEMLELLGLAESDKCVIVSIIKEERAKEALATLEEKFRTIKNGKGIAYTVPMTETVGLAIYQFLANLPK